MNGGRVQQVGSPQELYRLPANLFVASFIGQANFLDGQPGADGATFVTGSGASIACARAAPEARCLMIRPETIAVLAAGATGRNVFPATIEVVTYLGATSEFTVRLAGGEALVVTTPSSTATPRNWTAGEPLSIRIDPECAIGILGT